MDWPLERACYIGFASMRATSSSIWSSITNIHQTNTNHPDTNDDPSAGTDQPTTNPHAGLSEQPDLSCQGNPGHFIPTRTESQRLLVDGYTQLITDRVQAGWTCDLVTNLFQQLRGPRASVIGQMMDEVQRVYSTLITRVHRRPRTAPNDELPLFIGAADLPVYKRDRSALPNVFCNGGLHFHVLALMPPVSRLKESLADHFAKMSGLYVGSGSSIQRIHVEPVVEGEARVVDYVLKTILNGRLSYDEAVLVLPRTRSELN
jgi:hypothetical protein